ncbi:MAG TPA: ATP-binding protein, partial [Caulobacteraceae bacterium]|nr:ATP-binding protein [Caulobacteraceae bacterium]
EMKEQAAALTMALHRAEAASRAKSEFLANVSHEIRTPLNGVLGLAEGLSRTDLDERQRDLLKTIVNSAATLDGILGDLLDFSRLEAGRLTVSETAFDLGELIEEAASSHRGAAEAKGLGFELVLDETTRRRVVGDPTRLRQILTNLLSNAVKFTSEGRVGLSVAKAARGDRYYFEVRDSGIGFEPDQAERLFTRFEQADGSITRQFGGTGLGLSISRQLAELMGGKVSAAGKPGRGAVFTLIVPLPAARGAPAAPEPEIERPDRALRVLVVDDNETNRRVAELILAAIGAEVVCVEDGRAGVGAVESGDFDVVLMDLQMPVMDGLSATRAIRAREAQAGLPRLPIVVLSANVMREHVEASNAAGADDHIGKPVRAETLIAAVLQAVEGERKAAAA